MRTAAIILCIIASLGGAAFYFYGSYATRVQEYRVPYAPDTAFKIRTRNGSVEIIADAETDVILVEATFKTRGKSKEAAEKRLLDFELDLVRDEGGVQIIRPVFPSNNNLTDGCSLVIRTPGGKIGRIESSNGSITTRGIAGPGYVDSSNGSLTIEGSGAGDLQLSSSNGSIEVRGATGKVNAATSNGSIDVTLKDGATGGLSLESSNGEIVVDMPAAVGGVIQAKTSNGKVKVSGEDRAKTLELKKSSGRVVLPEEGPMSSLKTSNGTVKITLR